MCWNDENEPKEAENGPNKNYRYLMHNCYVEKVLSH